MLKQGLVGACVASLASAIVCPAQATDYFVRFNETAAGVQLTTNWPVGPQSTEPNEVHPYPGGSEGALGQEFFFGSTYGGLSLLTAATGHDNYASIIWHDATGPLFNVLTIIPSGNRGNVVFGLTTNVADPVSVNLNGDHYNALNRSCYNSDGYFPCPILNNGQALQTQLENGYDGYAVLGPLSISFTDGTSPAPEPAAWQIMICGFGLVGMRLRSRRMCLAG